MSIVVRLRQSNLDSWWQRGRKWGQRYSRDYAGRLGDIEMTKEEGKDYVLLDPTQLEKGLEEGLIFKEIMMNLISGISR